MDTLRQSMPQARKEGLTWKELGDDLVVYDLEHHRMHNLNRSAALVWRHCDGETTIEEMASRLHQELDLPAEDELVWSALERLGDADLLEERITRSAAALRCSRRDAMRKFGLAAGLAVLLPVVQSAVAPTPAQAASPGPLRGKKKIKKHVLNNAVNHTSSNASAVGKGLRK